MMAIVNVIPQPSTLSEPPRSKSGSLLLRGNSGDLQRRRRQQQQPRGHSDRRRRRKEQQRRQQSVFKAKRSQGDSLSLPDYQTCRQTFGRDFEKRADERTDGRADERAVEMLRWHGGMRAQPGGEKRRRPREIKKQRPLFLCLFSPERGYRVREH